MVRPHLEYANSVWCPYKKCDIEIIEKVHASLGTPSSHAATTPASQPACSLIAVAEYLMTGD